MKQDIRQLTLAELKIFLQQNGEKEYKANQIEEWIWKNNIRDFNLMSNISQKVRDLLTNHFSIPFLHIHSQQQAIDDTIKYAFMLPDSNLVEGVLIPTENRTTACVSSQVGCSLSCKFCATGYMKKKRNLHASEIYDQVVMIQKQSLEKYNSPLSNIVYMGMGEPLLNYAQVMMSIEKLTSPKTGLGLSPKRITLSTSGIAKMIQKLADDAVKFNLALSLHAANDTKRNSIMAINESNNIKTLIEALRYFYVKTKNKITFEYILFADWNDSLKDAQELFLLTKHFPVKINIIEYNPIQEASFQKAEPEALEKFKEYLQKKEVIVNVRRSRGKDIAAACGQLASKESIQ
ncbi:MAG: 23S rRNA (adenine(2503)-C(2))-methyltransferase RlmN [Chitinophagaceae bacterium]|nr:23S rRNA (adenine(2503)-C(2))-methyltransferase RlmN [Chitinophagaceae bacterium]